MNERLLIQKALSAHAAGRLAEATQLYGQILRANPGHFPALYALSVVRLQGGEYAEAERLTAEAVRLNPASPEAFYTRGCALQRLNRNPEALFCFDKALALKPGYVDALTNRAVAQMGMNRLEEAMNSLDVALALDPKVQNAWNNRGCIFQMLRRNADALACFDKELASNPANVEVLVNRGGALSELKRFDEAAESYERARAMDPDYPYLLGNLAFARAHGCEWRDRAQLQAQVEHAISAGKRSILPFPHLALSDSPAAQRRSAEIWAQSECPAVPPLWRGERYRHERIRIAYVSADFHAHATTHLMAGVFEAHDRSRFETTAISFGPDDQSAMRARVKSTFHNFLDVGAMGDSDIAKEMRRLEIDIAVDVKGYTQSNRARLFSYRPAPVQAQYLAYPGTMGASFMDYLIADNIVVPDEHRAFYSEKIVTLPDAYQCNDRKRAVAQTRPARAEAGLPDGAFVFCCFNNSYKIAPEMFACWMRLLRTTEGSVLWLLKSNAWSERNLRTAAAAAGIDPSRIVFAEPLEPERHLARHALADLFLDTLPYGAHTTASDALWMELPVVTCLGNTFAGRVAASLLHAAGVPELVTRSIDDYESLALTLARDPKRLSELKTKLAHARDASPLFDTARITRHLEAAYIAMWERQQRGLTPDHIAITAIETART